MGQPPCHFRLNGTSVGRWPDSPGVAPRHDMPAPQPRRFRIVRNRLVSLPTLRHRRYDGFLDQRKKNHVGKDIQRRLKMLGRDFGVVAGLLFAGKSVEGAAHAFDGAFDLVAGILETAKKRVVGEFIVRSS